MSSLASLSCAQFAGAKPRSIADLVKGIFSGGLAAQVKAILAKYGTDANVYLPGIGVINGLTAGNYLDSVGTTVATVDNPVGLVLDAANGDLGNEVVINGDFSDTSAWTVPATWEISGGKLNSTSASAANTSQAGILTLGKLYRVSFTISNFSAGVVQVLVGSTGTGATLSSNGTFTGYVVCSGSTTLFVNKNAAFLGSVDNVSVKEVTGIHALQATTANKPILRRGAVNQLTYSEQFDNAAWTKNGLLAFGSGSVSNTTETLDPIGGNTADKIVENTTNGLHNIGENITLPINTTYTQTYYIKAAGRTKVQFRRGNAAAFPIGPTALVFDLSAGTYSGSLASGWVNPTMVAVGNGWYRIGITATTVTAGLDSLSIYLCDVTGNQTYTGDGTSGIYIWGAQLQVGTSPTDYVATTTAAASSSTGNYWWQFSDSTDVLSATFPAGYESATIINTAETGQVTYTAQNIVGNYDIRGAVISPELITNGSFATDTNWTKVGNATISGGTGNLDGNGAQALLFQSNVLTNGLFYKVTFEIISITGTLNVWDNSGASLASYTTTGIKTFYFRHSIADRQFVFRAALGNNVASVDNVSVRQATDKEYARFIFRTGLTASELTTIQTFANRLAGV